MTEITLTVSQLKKFFHLRQQYLETFILFITCILKSHTVNIQKLCLHANTNTKFESVYKKMRRFLKNAKLDPVCVARLILCILKIDLNSKHIVIIDRTYWMFGKTHLNFLYLAIVVKGYAIPIFFVLCGPNKKGHSSVLEREKIFEYFDLMFSFSNIEYVLADREFMGGEWIMYLQERNIHFVQRCKEKKLYISNKKGEMVLASTFYNHLKPGKKIYLGRRKVGKSKKAFSAYITILKTQTGEIVLLAHSKRLEDPCLKYRKRYKIETCFRSLKSRGFNIEDGSITHPERIANLLCLVNVAFAIAFKLGDKINKIKPIKIKKHGRRACCFIKIALHYIICYFTRFERVFYSITNVLNCIKPLINRGLK